MTATAYYNEIDPFAAQWLRNLIDAGHIAPGVVDSRSIEEVTPNDLKGFKQCHFFAGIGVWSYALRRAGWPDDRPVWTGSCPCQPFSVCGSKKGKSDKRHLFPAWFRLISECQPNVIFGEQVASKDGLDWLDDVQAKLENAAYAFAGFDLCAAGFGAPHIRQRLFWVADADSNGREGRLSGWQDSQREAVNGSVGCDSATNRLAHTNNDRQQSGCRDGGGCKPPIEGYNSGWCGTANISNAVGGFWAGSDWIFCRDGKWRPVKPGLKPLVDGVAGRVGQLRAYGNAIVAPVAEAFIRAYMEAVTQ
ncbi:DNA cytosine methyltransferase [Salmonella enterica]|uniref:DNA (cytosine-5-)-methyltransferase n=1 Tax=Salmonella enterica TaxID=28901 RepID=A0A3X7ZQH3_SALER|nr:DNA cytosine methyltransferase [Salmonella enterica]EBW8696508.1 DNA cytosine methyltransferase [Salmonella enterica subsp. diarizonae serovar 16:z10:e,n,x,z15]ECV1144057.1 DNA cytosine methyltransferase [Salmonella enterica subsp. enterica]EDQ7380837.1 DNA cytosine methyltransferase [Salmonella enterica subsp. diarizonae serovar 35:l,v:z35]EIZ8432248.1 DNA cytosine methyltransferase [Salmonella enterica subsp. diarizonae]